MLLPRHVHRFAIGLALFSMFFGSGNLIFPLALGVDMGTSFGSAMAGFLISGVLLPFAGVIAMVVYDGDYLKFFQTVGKKRGAFLAFILLTAWIPLGSGPRCVVLAYANVSSYLGGLPLWAFSLAYCVVVWLFTRHRGRVLDILGYVLTPLLLTCLAILLLFGITSATTPAASAVGAGAAFSEGLLGGYQTMDLIAAFFFASSVIQILRQAGADGKAGHETPLHLAGQASIVGMLLLGSVYVGLIAVSAFHSGDLAGVPKEALLSSLAHLVLGPQLSLVASIAASLACLTTSVALTVVYADYLFQNVATKTSKYSSILFVTIGMNFALSLVGFDGILAISGPLMQLLYPVVIALIVWNLGVKPVAAIVQRRLQGASS